MSKPKLTGLEAEIIGLIEEGWARWKIADKVGLGETTVRGVIKRLCERYGCSMKDLPERTKEDRNA